MPVSIDLSKKTTTMKSVAADGNCCFRSLCYVMGGRVDHPSLRSMLNAWLREHHTKKPHFVRDDGSTGPAGITTGDMLLSCLAGYEEWDKHKREHNIENEEDLVEDAINFCDQDGIFRRDGGTHRRRKLCMREESETHVWNGGQQDTSRHGGGPNSWDYDGLEGRGLEVPRSCHSLRRPAL